MLRSLEKSAKMYAEFRRIKNLNKPPGRSHLLKNQIKKRDRIGVGWFFIHILQLMMCRKFEVQVYK